MTWTKLNGRTTKRVFTTSLFPMTTYTVEIPEGSDPNVLEAFLSALKFPFRKTASQVEQPYNEAFVAKIQEGRQQIREGKTFTVNLEDLWK